jgi:competence protein ComEA
MSTHDSPTPAARRPLWRRADQAGIAAIGLFALVAIGGYWYSQAMLRGRLIDIDRAGPQSAAFQVDINSAELPELIQLPGVGETLARRIIEWRIAHGPFQSVEELRHVSGIGPKRLESWRPYLRAGAGPIYQPDRAIVQNKN